jgi:hypothetical protein
VPDPAGSLAVGIPRLGVARIVVNGIPSKVTWSVPSGRVMVPSSPPVTAMPAAGLVAPDGTVSGGQVVAQPPVQVVFPMPSGV